MENEEEVEDAYHLAEAISDFVPEDTSAKVVVAAFVICLKGILDNEYLGEREKDIIKEFITMEINDV